MKRAQATSRQQTGGSATVVIIGAGHAGLAMSRCLALRAIDHVVLERGDIAHAWRRQRWDSLRLLTPNWQCRLPDFAYTGADPDGFMAMPEVIDFIERYAAYIDAPVVTGTPVQSVRGINTSNGTSNGTGYIVRTPHGEWRCRCVVIASGAFSTPVLPAFAQQLPATVHSLHAHEYRNPAQLEAGGVLVVGGSATGLQLADEIQRSGRPVFLSCGEHVRMPRRYRGRDIQWWMHATGLLDQRHDAIDDLQRARRVPSPQLIGSVEQRTLDLNALQAAGVQVCGRLMGIDAERAVFSGSLRNHCALADLKQSRLLDLIDRWIAAQGLTPLLPPAERPQPTRVDAAPLLQLPWRAQRIRTVLWATGFRPDYAWLDVPVFDRRGNLRHHGGVVDAPGLYVLGLPFMRRRKSSFIHGAEDDARELAAHLVSFLDVQSQPTIASQICSGVLPAQSMEISA